MRWTMMLLAVVVVLVAAPACTDASRLAMAGASLEARHCRQPPVQHYGHGGALCSSEPPLPQTLRIGLAERHPR